LNQAAIIEGAHNLLGLAFLNDPARNRGTAFTEDERELPGLKRYIYLIGLSNESLFYRTRTEKLVSKLFGCLFARLVAVATAAPPALARASTELSHDTTRMARLSTVLTSFTSGGVTAPAPQKSEHLPQIPTRSIRANRHGGTE
jgi:hypothetical protein